MRKDELMSGDIIVSRDGELGIVILDGQDCIMYQHVGLQWLDDMTDDLLDATACGDTSEADIMEVCRGNTFRDLDEGYEYCNFIWCRDPQWNRPSAEECRAKREAEAQVFKETQAEVAKAREEERKDYIFVITQQFYGNRTGTEIKREDMRYFIRGHLDTSFADDVDTVDLRTIPVPGAEHIVIVYDQTQEEEYINVEFPEYYATYGAEYLEHTGRELTMKPSCEISQLGVTLYTRCLACRIDEDGNFQSLEDGDGEYFINFFAE